MNPGTNSTWRHSVEKHIFFRALNSSFLLFLKNTLLTTSKGSLSGHAFPRLSAHAQDTSWRHFCAWTKFYPTGQNQTRSLQYVHLAPRFKSQPFPMWVQSKVVQTWRDKNSHVSLLSQVILLKLSVQKGRKESPSFLLPTLHSGAGQRFLTSTVNGGCRAAREGKCQLNHLWCHFL